MTQLKKRIKSFVRREGRITPSQAKAFENIYHKHGIILQKTPYEKIFGRTAPVILEIGFGNGESLFTTAREHPEQNYIGIEVHRPGVGRLLNAIEQEGLTNIKVCCEDAVEILQQCIPENSIDGINIFFPDPWPKKKHHKRRLISALRLGGVLLCRCSFVLGALLQL